MRTTIGQSIMLCVFFGCPWDWMGCWYIFHNRCVKNYRSVCACMSEWVFSVQKGTKPTLIELADTWKGSECVCFGMHVTRRIRIRICKLNSSSLWHKNTWALRFFLMLSCCFFFKFHAEFSDKWVLKNGWNPQQSEGERVLCKFVSILARMRCFWRCITPVSTILLNTLIRHVSPLKRAQDSCGANRVMYTVYLECQAYTSSNWIFISLNFDFVIFQLLFVVAVDVVVVVGKSPHCWCFCRCGRSRCWQPSSLFHISCRKMHAHTNTQRCSK